MLSAREKIDHAARSATLAIESARRNNKIPLVIIFAGPEDGFQQAEVVAPGGLPDETIRSILMSMLVSTSLDAMERKQ